MFHRLFTIQIVWTISSYFINEYFIMHVKQITTAMEYGDDCENLILYFFFVQNSTLSAINLQCTVNAAVDLSSSKQIKHSNLIYRRYNLPIKYVYICACLSECLCVMCCYTPVTDSLFTWPCVFILNLFLYWTWTINFNE